MSVSIFRGEPPPQIKEWFKTGVAPRPSGIDQATKDSMVNFMSLMKLLVPHLAYVDTTHNANTMISCADEALSAWSNIDSSGGDKTYYTITKNIQHGSIYGDGGITSIEANGRYLGTLEIDGGYDLVSITITMGGIDITSSSWASGLSEINIQAVTGNVVITVVAQTVEIIDLNIYTEPSPLVVTAGTTLEDLRNYIDVYAVRSSGDEDRVTAYTLSGSLNEGTNTITVSYLNLTKTFEVEVVQESLSGLNATLSLSDDTIYDYNAPNDLRKYLTVTYDGSPVLSGDYGVSGPMKGGVTNTLSVTYNDETKTISVPVQTKFIRNKVSLPAGYTLLTYIESRPDTENGLSGAVFKLSGITAADVSYAKYGVQPTTTSSTKRSHILTTKDTFYPTLMRVNNAGKVQGANASGSGTGFKYNWSDGSNYILEAYPDIYVNGEKIATLEKGTSTETQPFFLFGYSTNGTTVNTTFLANNMRLYFLRMYGNSHELTHDFIPCKDANNNVGLYDLIGSTFYTYVTYSWACAPIPGDEIT